MAKALLTLAESSELMWRAFLQGDVVRASSLARHCLRIDPRHARAKILQAVFAWRNGATDLGLSLCRQAFAANPRDLEIIKVAARQHMEAGQTAEGIYYYREALVLTGDLVGAGDFRQFPDADAGTAYLVAQIDLALALLAAGQWAEGWKLYETRVPRELNVAKFVPGHSAAGPLLVLPEAGFGDAIQFARYLPKCPKGTIAWTRPTMHRLLESLDCGLDVLSAPLGAAPPEHGSWAFSMSLPHHLGLPLPTSAPYLGAGIVPSSRVVARAGLPAVGLVWGGSVGASRDRLRSLPGENLYRLLAYDKVHWHVLQQGPYLAALSHWHDKSSLTQHGSADFLETAELIQALDLVVTVDTSVAHLAGALGKPCWVMLSTVPDMRYPGLGAATPWYAEHRLFRQPKPGAWGAVIDQVLAGLDRL